MDVTSVPTDFEPLHASATVGACGEKERMKVHARPESRVETLANGDATGVRRAGADEAEYLLGAAA